VAALLGPDIATDVQTLGLIAGPALTAAAGWALLPALVRSPSPGRHRLGGGSGGGDCEEQRVPVTGPHTEEAAAAAAGLDSESAAALAVVAERFRLNDAQAGVAAHVATWLPEIKRRGAEVVVKGQPLRRPALSKPTVMQRRGEESGGGGEAGDGAGGSGNEPVAGSPAPPVCLVHGEMGVSCLLEGDAVCRQGYLKISVGRSVQCHCRACVPPPPGMSSPVWRHRRPNCKWLVKPACCPLVSTPGPFGSGKSTLLVALIHLLTRASGPATTSVARAAPASKRPRVSAVGEQAGGEQPQQQKRQPAAAGARSKGGGVRVLVAAHTNVAVDRVLLGLAGGW
jgi:hypothetical protein